jgi:DNA processing protein
MLEADSLAWITLARAPGLAATQLSSALALVEAPAHLLTASDALWSLAGIPHVTREFLTSAAAGPLPAERRWLEADHHHLIPFTDPRYPRLLRSIDRHPIALYLSGNPNALDGPQLAVIGTRNPTAQGRDTALEFAAQLAQRGLGIVSGAAEGIDGSAHRGALDAQGLTVGVLGTGVDLVYPSHHAPLYRDIERYGALVSEFTLGTPPRRGNFPQRNRVIAALSLGTLVVEAARRSGSLITARCATTYGRQVFAVPGSLHNPMSRGCHELIKGGARLVESAADILRALNFSAFFSNDFHASGDGDEPPPHASGMDKDHKILLDALGFDPVDLDLLVERTGFKPEAVSSMMLILELEGHVQAALGGRYSRVAYRRAAGER